MTKSMHRAHYSMTQVTCIILKEAIRRTFESMSYKFRDFYTNCISSCSIRSELPTDVTLTPMLPDILKAHFQP